MVVTLSVGHAGWYVVRERNGCGGNHGYMALAIGFVMATMWAFSSLDERPKYENLRYVTVFSFVPLAYLEVACWKLGCGTAARQLSTQVREQISAARYQRPPPPAVDLAPTFAGP
mmetsp:Transcript_12156/g.33243  ORF Transcript_12156/g.33243 Transcript_12156/m.33243 type:complete len:115 (+) Transcript_12156:136-480(+)